MYTVLQASKQGGSVAYLCVGGPSTHSSEAPQREQFGKPGVSLPPIGEGVWCYHGSQKLANSIVVHRSQLSLIFSSLSLVGEVVAD